MEPLVFATFLQSVMSCFRKVLTVKFEAHGFSFPPLVRHSLCSLTLWQILPTDCLRFSKEEFFPPGCSDSPRMFCSFAESHFTNAPFFIGVVDKQPMADEITLIHLISSYTQNHS
ncbi:unnamed protein product [Calicophoron daubneyi]|uniref:Uncharacterized protein n=1 Tax=Calicophoron daubneyi TaxID=300641 RepID=A0AAV2TJC3_CALDB